MIETYILTVLRVFCIISFAWLLVHSAYYLIALPSDRETRRVRYFVVLLMSSLTYAFVVSVYNMSVAGSGVGPNRVYTITVVLMFSISGAYGLYLFKPWKWK